MIGKKVSQVCKKVSNGIRKAGLGCGSSLRSVVSNSDQECHANSADVSTSQELGPNQPFSCGSHESERRCTPTSLQSFHMKNNGVESGQSGQHSQSHLASGLHCNRCVCSIGEHERKPKCSKHFDGHATIQANACPTNLLGNTRLIVKEKGRRKIHSFGRFQRFRKVSREIYSSCECSKVRPACCHPRQPCSWACSHSGYHGMTSPGPRDQPPSFSQMHCFYPWMVPNPLAEWLSTAKQIHGAQCAQNIPCSCGLHSNTAPTKPLDFTKLSEKQHESEPVGIKRANPEKESQQPEVKRMKRNLIEMPTECAVHTSNGDKACVEDEPRQSKERDETSHEDVMNRAALTSPPASKGESTSAQKNTSSKMCTEPGLHDKKENTNYIREENQPEILSDTSKPSFDVEKEKPTSASEKHLSLTVFDAPELKGKKAPGTKNEQVGEMCFSLRRESRKPLCTDSFHADGFSAPPATPHDLTNEVHEQIIAAQHYGDFVGSGPQSNEPATKSQLNAFSRSTGDHSERAKEEKNNVEKSTCVLNHYEQEPYQQWSGASPQDFINNAYATPQEQPRQVPQSPYISARDVEDVGYEMYPEGEHMEFPTPQGHFIARPSNEAVASTIRKAPLEEIVDALSRRPRYCAEYGGTPSRRRVARWVETPACFDDFRIEGLLGRGGFGVVLEVSPLRGAIPRGPLPARMALKVVPLAGMDRPSYNSLMNEIRVHTGVPPHPCVLRVLLSFRERAVHFFGMPLLSGGSLYNAWERAGRNVPGPAALRAVQQILAGLAHLHSYGWAHMDIKPDNVMLAWQRDEARGDDAMPALKLIDFSLAQRFNVDDEDDWADNWRGTEAYMSPQVWEMCHSPPKSDMYSVGVTLYQLVTGYLPKGKAPTGSDEHFRIMEYEDYIFHDKEWKTCDRRMMNLCRSLLSYDERQRPTAVRALNIVNDILRSFVPMDGDGSQVYVDPAVPPGFESKKTVIKMNAVQNDGNQAEHVLEQKVDKMINEIGVEADGYHELSADTSWDELEEHNERRIHTL